MHLTMSLRINRRLGFAFIRMHKQTCNWKHMLTKFTFQIKQTLQLVIFEMFQFY